MAEIFNPTLFKGTSWLITGGGTGIGLAAALQASQLGATTIAICGRRVEPLEKAKQLIEQSSKCKVFFQSCDIRDATAVDNFVDAVREQFGRVDILINNAGGQFPVNAEYLSSKGFEAVVKNNLFGTWNFTRAVAIKLFIPQKSGCIINVIAQIRNGFPGMVHTGAARAGVENLTKTLSIEWARFGIRVNAVAPGVIVTTGTAQYPPAMLEKAQESAPLQRNGNAEEVAFLILYLANEKASSFITGQTYYIDGGQSLNGHFHSDTWIVKRPPKL